MECSPDSGAGGGGDHLAHVPQIGGTLGGGFPLVSGLKGNLGGLAAAIHAHYIEAPAVLFLQQPGMAADGAVLQINIHEQIHTHSPV